jgi:peptidoglycan hydrolase-like protein with peptidoglycan-binding domain
LATALRELRSEVDARWPHRDRTSDGSIGDAAHSATKSDHNPNAAGVVRAIDIDVDGIAAAWLTDYLRGRGAVGDPRLYGGGYVIFNARIASDVGNWAWRSYTGANPHTSHIHVSAAVSAIGYDASGPWGVWAPLPGTGGPIPTHKRGSRVLRLAEPQMAGSDVEYVQRWTGAAVTGGFDLNTDARVRRYQGIVGLEVDGVVGSDTWRAMKVETSP